MDNTQMELARLHSIASGDQTDTSFVEGVGNFFTKGVPLAAGSGLVSMYNTAASLGNVLGAEIDKINYSAEVASYDDDLSLYYKQHQTGVDVGGFIATSVIPGVVGLKALKMVQGGMAGKNAAAITGVFRTRQQLYGEKILEKIRNGPNELFDAVDKDKIAALAFGGLEQALQGAAFETAVLLSMNQSPILAKSDEQYFTSLWRNSPDIFIAAGVQGALGGLFGGLSTLGKFNKAVKQRDFAQKESVQRTLVGESDVDVGTAIAAGFAFLNDAKKTFEARKAAGTVSDAEIVNYNNSLRRNTETLQKELNRALLTSEEFLKGDGDLNNTLWKMLEESADPQETASLLFSAASKGERIGSDAIPAGGGPVVMTADGPLVERHARNILKRGKVAPEIVDTPTPDQITEWNALKYEMWKDTNGVFHVLEESNYAKTQLATFVNKRNPEVIVKLQGSDKGKVTEFAYPTVGDLGPVSVDPKRGFLVNNIEYPLLEAFDPIANSALDSNAQFTAARLLNSSLKASKIGQLDIAAGDLPKLEAAIFHDFPGQINYGDYPVGLDATSILNQEKVLAVRSLISSGKDFDFISRALNVTRDFAETQRGDGFMLSKLEDHTLPSFVRLAFETKNLPDQFYVRGVASLMERIAMGYQNNNKVAAVVLGEDFAKLPATDGVMVHVSTLPELGGIFSAASGEYGSWASAVQQIGKVVDSAVKRRLTETFQRTQPFDFKLKGSPPALQQWNLLVNKFRSGKEAYYRVELGDGTYYMPKELYNKLGDAEYVDVMDDLIAKSKNAKETIKVDFSDEAAKLSDEYLVNHMQINAERANQKNLIQSALGRDKIFNPDQIYVPPIDTRKYSFVAFVKERMELGEGNLKEAGVIVAATRQQLEAKINQVNKSFGDRFEVVTREQIQAHKEIQGSWEAGAFLGDSMVDSALKKEGILYEFQPRIDAEILADFNRWHYNQEQGIVRNAIELKYSQEFAELRAMGQQFKSYAETKFGPKNSKSSDLSNPYLRYIYTALNFGNFDRYNSLWGKFNETVEGFGSKMFAAWDNARAKAQKGEIDWTSANKIAESYGFTPPYKGVISSVVQPVIENSRVLEPFVAKVNGAVSTLTLGLDFLNSVVNVISAPIMLTAEMGNILRNINNPEIVGALKQITSVTIPGSTHQMPTSMKLLSNSVRRYIQDDGTLLNFYKTIGSIKGDLMLHKEVIDASILPAAAAETKEGFITWANGLAATTAKYGKMATGHNKAEEFVRFLAADMMKQMTDIAGVAASDVPTYINSFVNRVHGNYLASQRPHAFQGVVGQAISLFQTYQFNLAQNMVRYLGQDNKAAAAVLLGLQNTIFGLQSNPAFYLLNQAVGSSNPEHIDLVTGTKALVGEDVYKWVLYGLGSNAIQTSLYNRGDLTPRYLTVVPTQLKDIPAISIPAKTISTFIDTAGDIVKGGNVKESLLNGLAHFSANRPLAGLAQVAQGYRTTAKGNLLSAYNDLDGITIASKLAGGEELNRAIAFDQYYRTLAYQAKDRATLDSIGEAVKTTMYKGQMPSQDQVETFMSQYTRAGGSPITFNRWMIDRFKNSNESQLNIMKRHTNSRSGRMQAMMMGADTQDFYFNPPGTGLSE